LSLSVATYAWFFQNKEAVAKGVTVKSRRPDNILLSLDSAENSDWTNQLSLDVHNLQMKPVSTADCENWFTASAKGANLSANDPRGRADIRQIDSVGEEKNTYFAMKEFYLKSPFGDITATYVINVEPYNGDYNDDKQIDHLRVALVFETCSDFSNGTMEERTSRFYSYDYDNQALADVTGTTTTVPVSDYVTGSIRLKDDTPQKATLYAWYEGEDPQCIDENVGVKSVIDVAFTKTHGGGVLN
jgi:hypothetical protein